MLPHLNHMDRHVNIQSLKFIYSCETVEFLEKKYIPASLRVIFMLKYGLSHKSSRGTYPAGRLCALMAASDGCVVNIEAAQVPPTPLLPLGGLEVEFLCCRGLLYLMQHLDLVKYSSSVFESIYSPQYNF